MARQIGYEIKKCVIWKAKQNPEENENKVTGDLSNVKTEDMKQSEVSMETKVSDEKSEVKGEEGGSKVKEEIEGEAEEEEMDIDEGKSKRSKKAIVIDSDSE